eukprot:3450195-Amphidinium_carterae.1
MELSRSKHGAMIGYGHTLCAAKHSSLRSTILYAHAPAGPCLALEPQDQHQGGPISCTCRHLSARQGYGKNHTRHLTCEASAKGLEWLPNRIENAIDSAQTTSIPFSPVKATKTLAPFIAHVTLRVAGFTDSRQQSEGPHQHHFYIGSLGVRAPMVLQATANLELP